MTSGQLIDRQSLSWRIGSRLALILVVMTAIGVAGLAGHTYQIEAALGHQSLVHDVIQEFFVDLAWGIPLLIIGLIVAGWWIVRRAMAPLRHVAEAARAIGPGQPEARLPTNNIPSEVIPLVDAANGALERLQHAYVLQQRFIANAAHELRTPVAVFRAAVERLPSGQERTHLLQDVDRMARLTGQLLDLARAECMQTSNADADVSAVARDVVEQLAPLAASRKVGIALEFPETAIVGGSNEALNSIVRNLVENAVFHAPPGSEVRIAGVDNRTLLVEDHGPGVPQESRRMIFDRFERGSWTQSSGSGLGLSIAAEAAARIGAELSVEDNQPNGARFIVRFRQ